jgi:hypothetical protein
MGLKSSLLEKFAANLSGHFTVRHMSSFMYFEHYLCSRLIILSFIKVQITIEGDAPERLAPTDLKVQ